MRPIIPFDLDDSEGSALEDEDETAEMGPMPIERSTPFAVQDSGKGVDEVEVSIGRSDPLYLGLTCACSTCTENDL